MIYTQRFELIDTLWNVNMEDLLEEARKLAELIDTLWNVNGIFPCSLHSSNLN